MVEIWIVTILSRVAILKYEMFAARLGWILRHSLALPFHCSMAPIVFINCRKLSKVTQKTFPSWFFKSETEPSKLKFQTNPLRRRKVKGYIHLFWLSYQITDMLSINSNLTVTNFNAMLRCRQQLLLCFQILLVRSLEGGEHLQLVGQFVQVCFGFWAFL